MAVEEAVAGRRARTADGAGERRWLLWPPLAFFVLLLGVPVAALVRQALSGEGNAFAESIRMTVFVDAVGRTLLLAAVATAATVLVGTCYALAVAVGPAWVKALLMGAC
ncbi:hypothetical protein Psuf_004110 [Phytohabitans suffuscus]|uniref:ABC transmembrane type-1 domain-containing protein n=1 Tax=Phytohabitans suffuscus TaxID=624315 RepID=A0A6F8YAT7_9ACTN|nr:hypothetical protein [Phytohabitans suffuscus]BCB83098.1 hypothetical protein Psuf_004110 [Phytohabitans suffuscus]